MITSKYCPVAALVRVKTASVWGSGTWLVNEAVP